jgi:diacylglycerol O-acyltransferase
MERLKGTDARYLYEENPTQPMHTIKIAVLAPSTGPRGYAFERLREHLALRSARLPPLRRRLLPVSLALGCPSWIEVARINPQRHIRRISVPAPGGPNALCQVISHLAGKQLDRRYPLWEIWVVEEIERDRVTLILKIHHALADGQAALRLLSELLEGSPGEIDRAPDGSTGLQTTAGLLLSFLGPLLEKLARLPALLVRTAASCVVGWRDGKKSASVAPFSAPLTRFNRRLTSERACALCTVDFADVQAIKSVFGCTLNDVVLAVAGGAVRTYLERRGELPGVALTADVPVSLRPRGECPAWGNCLSDLFTSLHTNIADPVQRLRAVRRSMEAAKTGLTDLDQSVLKAWWEDYGPLAAGCVRVLSSLLAGATGRASYSLIVSNVRGPARPLSCDGIRVTSLHSLGLIAYDLGLNITAWSYLEHLNFGVLACRRHMPDVWELANHIPEQLAELYRAAGQFRTVAPYDRRSASGEVVQGCVATGSSEAEARP